jgi:hypothetical protein
MAGAAAVGAGGVTGPRWPGPAVAALLGLAALALLWRLEPTPGGPYPPCPIRAATGLLCPGCGTLRALHALVHGELGAAFRLNPLAMSLLPLVLLGLVQQWRPSAVPWLAAPVLAPRWRVWVLFGLIVAFGVARNLPLEPFSLLAPRP